MSFNPQLGRLRGANVIMAYAETVSNPDDTRRASGRNVKRSQPNHTYDAVRVWTLKEKRDGRWVIVRTGVGPEVVREWLGHDQFTR